MEIRRPVSRFSCVLFLDWLYVTIAGYLTQLEVNITSKSSKAVILNWEPFKMDDARKLLGYEVYTIEAPYKNVTLYDGRDACGGDGY